MLVNFENRSESEKKPCKFEKIIAEVEFVHYKLSCLLRWQMSKYSQEKYIQEKHFISLQFSSEFLLLK